MMTDTVKGNMKAGWDGDRYMYRVEYPWQVQALPFSSLARLASQTRYPDPQKSVAYWWRGPFRIQG